MEKEKVAFPDPLTLRDGGMRGDSRIFETTGTFRFFSSWGTITVPARFQSDGASIPRIFWNILHPFGRYFHAALIHDFLYRSRIVPRDIADKIFLEAMEACGVGWITRRTIYRAVRIFGGMHF